MEEIYIIIDESGGKGYSDKQESYKNEIGLICGYIINEKDLNDFINDTDKIYNKYNNDQKKLHLTNCYKKEENEIKENYNTIFKKYKTECFYEAIYVQGFYEFEKKYKEKVRSSNNKINEMGFLINNHIENKQLYMELFTALFMKIFLYFYQQYNTSNMKFKIIIDNVDESILKSMKKTLQKVIYDFIHRNDIKEILSYKKEKTVDGRYIIDTGIRYPENMNFEKIHFNIESKNNSLTLGADIIAKTLRNHLEEKSSHKPLKCLNTKNAIVDYDMNYLLSNSTLKEDNFGDMIYRHPNI